MERTPYNIPEEDLFYNRVMPRRGMPRVRRRAGGITMIYRALIGIGLFTIGYYLGRQVGRAQALQEQLRYARESGGSTDLRQIATMKTPPDGVLSFSRPAPSTAG